MDDAMPERCGADNRSKSVSLLTNDDTLSKICYVVVFSSVWFLPSSVVSFNSYSHYLFLKESKWKPCRLAVIKFVEETPNISTPTHC